MGLPSFDICHELLLATFTSGAKDTHAACTVDHRVRLEDRSRSTKASESEFLKLYDLVLP